MGTLEEHRRYVEEIALHFEQGGLSRTAGRIFGWLLISDPPHQSMNDLVRDLQVSKSSVSVATRSLIQSGLVQRLSLPGERQDYYCVVDDLWHRVMDQRTNELTVFRKLAEKGLALLSSQPLERRQRLQEMRDFYAFFEQEIPDLLGRWHAQRSGEKERTNP